MQFRKSHSKASGFTMVEMLIVLSVIAIVLAVSIPYLTGALSGASETAVMREVQTIHEAQIQYHSLYGDYAAQLSQLGPPLNGVIGPQAAKLIPGSLASGEKDGYLFLLAKTAAGFTVNANPKIFGKSGRRTFYIDEDGVIHQNLGSEPATVSSPEIK